MHKDILTRAAQVMQDSVNEDNRTVEFVISTEAVDSYGTVFRADGWDFTRYNTNPIVTYQHDDHSSDPDVVVGTSVVRQEGKNTIAVLTFENFEDNPLAKKVFRKVKNNILRGASVHFHPSDAVWGDKDKGEDPNVLYFTRQSLVAWSIVTIPSNPETLKRNMDFVSSFKKPESQNTTVTEVKKRNLSTVDAQVIINQNSQLR